MKSVKLLGILMLMQSTSLAYYSTCLVLGVHPAFENDVVSRIWSMQNQTNGGISTHIMPDGSSGASDTNTETTAMVILGITSVMQPPPIPESDSPVLMLCISVLLCAMIIRSIRRR